MSEVVRRRVKLTKAGREWRGLSPFNAERTPSFYVNDQKMAWFDHSAGKNGNIFDFLMETEGLSFPEAVERLAQEAGLPLPRSSPQAEAQEKQRASLHDVLDAAAAFFVGALKGRAGASARDYLAGRGLTPAIQSEFQLGYAPPEKFALRDHLAGKGISSEMMIEAGLLVHGDEIAVPYDRFRDRIMFPIADRNGRIIAFGGRALAKDVQAKYLNSPETVLFHKGAVLYNHHRARKAAHDAGTVIAVEGYVDVIAMSAAAFPQTVAPLGTALTADQCELLWKMSEEPILCFDGDRAGRKAAFRAIDLALPLIGIGRSLRFALLPEGQDPDDLARTGGAEAVKAVIEAALPLVDLIWQRETEAHTLATPEQRAALERRMQVLSGEIRDETLRRHYQAEFRDRLARLFNRGRPETAAAGAGPRQASRAMKSRPSGRGRFGSDEPLSYVTLPLPVGPGLARSLFIRKAPDVSARELLIFLIFLNHPALLDPYGEPFAGLDLGTAEAVAVRNKMLDLWAHDRVDERSGPGALREGLVAGGFAAFLRRLDQSAHAALWVAAPEAADSDAEEALKQALALHRKSRALHSELQSAEAALAADASEVNLARLLDIREQLSALTGVEATIDGFGAASGRQSGLA